MIFFPTHTDRKLKHTPWVNYTLIAVNVVVFILTANQVDRVQEYFSVLNFVHDVPTVAHVKEPWLLSYYLQPGGGSVLQYFSYQFLHSGWMHLIMNMLFLFVFGNGVEDRFGKVGYLFFYLAGGVIAGLGHAMLESNPVLGASGAVAGVTGAYLALFPLSNVTIVYWWIVPGSFEISSMLLILFQVAQDVLFQLGGVAGTAYLAHLAGYAGGFAFGMGLLMLRILPREPYDMLALIEQRRRRAQFSRLAQQGYQPWEHSRPGEPPKGGETPVTTEKQERVMRQRAGINAALAAHDMPKAAELYTQLLQTDPEQVLGRQQQLDIANQLMSEGQYEVSASAYQLFLVTYKSYSDKQQVQLILGLIFARYLDQRQRAKELLSQAIPRLTGDELALAKQVLDEIS